MTAVAQEVWTAAQWNTGVRDNMKQTLPFLASTSGRWFCSETINPTVLAEREIAADTNIDDGTTTSATYTSTLTGSVGNCAVTVTTGTSALVFVNALMSSSSSSTVQLCSVGVTGATPTIAASDNWAWQCDGVTAANANRGGTVVYFGEGGDHGALTPGSNTFTAQFRSSGGSTLTVNNSEIIVFAM
jgi:hypothetical protein